MATSQQVKKPTERSFGLVFTIFFSVIGLWPLTSGNPIKISALYLAAAFAVITLVAPILLRPLNIIWFRFGLLLHKIVSPLVMAVIFFAVITPIGLIMRLVGKDILSLKIDKAAKSYWVLRSPPGPEPKSLINQF